MRFFRLHPAFQLLFALSVIALVGAFMIGVDAADSCNSSAPSPSCAVQAQGKGLTAIVAAIGSLALMIGGVGFQIGRSAAQAAYPAQPPYPAQAMAPGPVPQGYPQHYQAAPGAPSRPDPSQGGQGWSGQPPASR
jgi:hypothetical protein